MLCGLSLFFGKKLFQLAEKDETISCSVQKLLFVWMHRAKNFIAQHSLLYYLLLICLYGGGTSDQQNKTNGAKNLCAGGLHEQKQK
jgi:hypothetical protein